MNNATKPLTIITSPNPLLRKKALPITKIDKSIRLLAKQMLELVYENNGIGLAANQVGILKQIIVIDLQIDNIKKPMVMINPVITKTSTETVDSEEGCLSLPLILSVIKRFATIEVEYTDLNSKKHKLKAEDLLAICIQHEVDHLNGILFIDHLSRLKKQLILKKYKKLNQEKEK